MLPLLLTPRWLALHVLTALAVLLMGFLGWWQAGAYQRQEADRAQALAAEAGAAPTAPVAELAPPGEPLAAAAVGRSAHAQGVYLATWTIPGRAGPAGDESVWVLSELQTEDAVVPVLRGSAAPSDAAAAAPPTGEVRVRGTVQAFEPESGGGLGTTLPAGQLPGLSANAVYQASSVPPSTMVPALLVVQEEVLVESGSAVDEPARIAVDALPSADRVSGWRHLSYAAQWWVFAVAALAFWGVFVRAGLRSRRGPHEPDEAPSPASTDQSAGV